MLSAPPICQVENVWIADSVFPSDCAFMAKRVFLTMIGILTIVPYVLGAMLKSPPWLGLKTDNYIVIAFF